MAKLIYETNASLNPVVLVEYLKYKNRRKKILRNAKNVKNVVVTYAYARIGFGFFFI